MFKVYWSN